MGILSDKKKISIISALLLLALSGWRLWAAETTVQESSPKIAIQNQVKSTAGEVLGSADELNLEEVVVQRVVDGDTIVLVDGRTVRYIGIDTPETKHPTKGVQCFGPEASSKNSQLVLGKTIQLEKDVSETDRYGRLLRYVWLEGRLINEQLVAEGYAQASSYPPDIARQQQLLQAEKNAREANLGLWSSCQDQVEEKASSEPTLVNQRTDIFANNSCQIKGNISTKGKLYHPPGCSSYQVTVIDENRGEQWFCTELEAENAGWTKAGGC